MKIKPVAAAVCVLLSFGPLLLAQKPGRQLIPKAVDGDETFVRRYKIVLSKGP